MKTIKSNFLIIVLLVLFSQNSYAQFNYKQWPNFFAYDFNPITNPQNLIQFRTLDLGALDTIVKKNYIGNNINTNNYVAWKFTAVFCDPSSGKARLLADENRCGIYLKNDTISNLQYPLNQSTANVIIDTGFYRSNRNIYSPPLPLLKDYGDGTLIAVPNSQDSLVYFIDFSAKDSTLHYSVINIGNINSTPYIQEIDKKTDATCITGRISFAMHANGHDFWVIAHQTNSDTMLAYRFTQNGYAYTVKSKCGPHLGWSINNVATSAYKDYVYGETKCSPNSKKICLLYAKWLWRNFNFPASFPSYYQATICLFDFNNQSGVVSNCLIDTNRSGKDYILTSTTFSSNSSKLYILSKTTNNQSGMYLNEHLLQYDLDSIKSNRLPSPFTLHTDTPSLVLQGGGLSALNRYYLFPTYMNLGLNGRIYLDNQHDSLRGILFNPNAAGIACRYNATAIKMPRAYIPHTPPFASRKLDTNYLSICSGKSIIYNNHTYSAAGTYYDTLLNFLNYDSIVINQVVLKNNTQSLLNRSACSNNGYYFNGQQLYQNGIYFDTLINQLGCDSMIELHLSISTLPSNTVTIQDSTLTASTIGCGYQWYECVSGAGGTNIQVLIPGATSQTYTVQHSGMYSVQIIVDSCSANSDCYSVVRFATGMLELAQSDFIVSSIITNETIAWTLKSVSNNYIKNYLVTNALGQQIMAGTQTSLPLQINGDKLPEGIYYLSIQTNAGIKTYKLKR
jgi:regulation of enolase protein 1 (concanavalin A-like superfamily)